MRKVNENEDESKIKCISLNDKIQCSFDKMKIIKLHTDKRWFYICCASS